MSRSKPIACLVLTVLTGFTVMAQESRWPEAVKKLTGYVEFLASDDLQGRMTGSEGEARAAEYLAGQLEKLGVEPLPGHTGYLYPFDFRAGMSDGGSSVELAIEGKEEPRRWSGPGQVQALSFSDNATVDGELIFAGYGLSTPESAEVPYDSYAGLDVKDKIVLVLRYVPEDLDPDSRAELARYSGLRYKALYAREQGAKGILVVTGPRSPNAGETIPMTFDAALSGSGIAAASISGEIADGIFERVAGKTLEQAQQELDDGNPHVAGFPIPGVRLTLDTRVKREPLTGHNVIGRIPRTESAGGQIREGCVVLGAHYDHLGLGNHGNSLARGEEKGQIHHGADDNASGVATVLRAAEILKRKPLRRPVVIALWSGEEIGLLGSSHFTKEPPIPLDEIVAYLNFDMVGRMRDNQLIVKGMGSSSVWSRMLEGLNAPAGFDIRPTEDPYVPSDATSFYLKGIPVLDFFTGAHEDYHRPTDRADKLDYEDMERVAFFAAAVTRQISRLDAPPDYVEVQPKAPVGPRESLRAFTGTIPDYAAEVEGLRLSGVVGGGPAEKAGLREGDVIVEFGGLKITNIYDYTHALERAQIGQDVKVVFLRDGRRMEATVTPSARK